MDITNNMVFSEEKQNPKETLGQRMRMLSSEYRALIRQAIIETPAHQYPLSFKDIQAKLGIPMGTCYKNIRRVLEEPQMQGYYTKKFGITQVIFKKVI